MPVRTALLVSDSLADSEVVFLSTVLDDLFEEDEVEEILRLLSLASSISICSCLHSWLQNGVSPLQIKKKNRKNQNPIQFKIYQNPRRKLSK